VPDDWEDDDDDDEPQTEQDNKRIWETANAKAPNPMPDLIISGPSTSTYHITSPPQSVLQPMMRILKRPPSNTGQTPSPAPLTADSLKERETRYQEARERIFGFEQPDSDTNIFPTRGNTPNQRDHQAPSDKRVLQNSRGQESGSQNGVVEKNLSRGS